MLAMKGSLNLYSTRDEASLFPGISLKKETTLTLRGFKFKGKREKEKKKEREKGSKKESKQINEETKMCAKMMQFNYSKRTIESQYKCSELKQTCAFRRAIVTFAHRLSYLLDH